MDILTKMIIYTADLIKGYIGNKYFFNGRMKRPWIALGGGVILLICLLSCSFTDSGGYVFTYIVTMLVTGLMIEGDIKTKLLRVVWLFCLSSFLDGSIDIIFSKAAGSKEMSYIFMAFSSVVILFVGGYLFNWLRVRFSNYKAVFSAVYVIIILVCMSIGFSISVIQFMFDLLPKEMELINLDYMTAIAYIAIVLLLVLIIYMQKLFALLEKATQAEKKMKQLQGAYFQGLLEKEEETRRYRHDMHNHLIYLREMARKEEAGKTEEYVKNLEVRWKEIGEGHYETGNTTLNILLNHYVRELKGVNISVNGMCHRSLKMEEIDLCTIFANLIQNAAEELEKQVGDDCFLAVELKQGEENTQIIIRNTASLILEENCKKIKTSKKDGKNHGIGLENVRETIERYDGVLSLSADGREFKAVVTMEV